MISKFLIVLIFSTLEVSNAFQLLREKMDVSSAELTVFTLSPSLFHWEWTPEIVKQIEYFPRLANAADLPAWIHYTYNDLTSTGHLYGTPPKENLVVSLDVVAVNRNFSFDVRQLTLTYNVTRRMALEYVVQFKIDNMEPRDFCNTKEIVRLAKTFSKYLDWHHRDGSPAIPVYLASPAHVGEIDFSRSYGAQGVIIHLGSDMNFSAEMTKLQNEVLPLAKLRPCPQNLKRTSVEKYFRSQRMIVDWCSFKLKHNNGTDSSEMTDTDPGQGQVEFGDYAKNIPPLRTEIPERSYTSTVLLVAIVPATLASLITVILIGIFWNDEDDSLPVNGDILFFETAFRVLFILFSCKSERQYYDDDVGDVGASRSVVGGGMSYQPYQDVAMGDDDDNFFLITGDEGRHDPEDDVRLQVRGQPLPQYRHPLTPPVAVHPNGNPALTYAV